MVKSGLSYEQIRLNRMNDNKRKMFELNLNKLAQSLRVSSSSPKRSRAKPKTPRVPVDLTEVRRSSRAKKTPPSYREIGLEPLEKPRRSYQRKDLQNRVYVSEEARDYALKRANKLQSSLSPNFPSLVKEMSQSHVTGGFWLGLDIDFCRRHMPHHDAKITLFEEKDEEYVTKYIAVKNGLSAGWRGFARDHKLVDGDHIVLQLVDRTTFKVYIIRVNGEPNNDSDGNGDKENVIQSNKKQVAGSRV